MQCKFKEFIRWKSGALPGYYPQGAAIYPHVQAERGCLGQV